MKNFIVILLSVLFFNTNQSCLKAQDTSILNEQTIDLPEGWSMFGYSCLDEVDVSIAFESIVENVLFVKDEWGLVYAPEWGFN